MLGRLRPKVLNDLAASLARCRVDRRLGTVVVAAERLHQRDFLTEPLPVDVDECNLLGNHRFARLHRDEAAGESAPVVRFGAVLRERNGQSSLRDI